MLLKTLKASCFKKYEALEIKDIPEKALIGIFGDNESGKSSIGDAVSFALFGRTAKFSGNSLSQLIHWDAEECEVELVFRVGDEDSEYRVVRYIDRKGSYKAVLYEGKQNSPLKTGVEKVNEAIKKLTCFDFDNFRYTFYLAQKEIDIFTQRVKSNSKEIIYQMMGFDRFAEAGRVVDEKEKELKGRLEKCETELLHTRADVKKIKVDQTMHKGLQEKLEEHRGEISDLEKSVKNDESTAAKQQEVLQVYDKLYETFQTLERSLRFQFHHESAKRSHLLLTSIYDLLNEEHSQLSQKLKECENTLETIEEDRQQAIEAKTQLQEVSALVDSYKEDIDARISAPDSSSATSSENLQVVAASQKKHIERTGKMGTIAAIGSFVIGTFTIYSFLSAILVAMGKEAILFHWKSSTPLWVMFICGLIAFIADAAAVLFYKKRLFEAREKHSQLNAQIETLEKQREICEAFDADDLAKLKEFGHSLHAENICRRIAQVEKKFDELIAKDIHLEKWQQELSQQHQNHTQEKERLDQRLSRVEVLRQKTKDPLGDDAPGKPHRERELEELEDLDSVEKQIEAAIRSLEDHRAAIEEFQPDEPPEMDNAWKVYEQQRNKFRELFGKSAIGGGTGMLNRIQMAFRQQSTEKLSSTLTQEKESFLGTLPQRENLEAELQQTQRALDDGRQQLQKLKESMKEIEGQYKECTEELHRKKDFINKINGLNSQIQNIERSIEVAKTTRSFFSATIDSANQRFAPSLSRIMSRILPRITGGRYQHVQVTEDLDIKAFSTEKNDFVDLSELSGGTVDQLFLALRLAFSQAVMTARVGSASRQFLFFDEPIISFDEQRSSSFLDLLAEYSENFVQIFLISPRSYEEINFDMIIRTKLESKKLVIGSGEGEQKKASKKSKGKKGAKEKAADAGDDDQKQQEEEEMEDELRYEYDGDDY